MKKFTWLPIFVLFTSVILTSTSYVKGDPSTWYVATIGSDAAAGDINHPFKTIQKAVDVAKAGDTIFIRGGTYHEWVRMKLSGTAGNPITLTNYNDETAIICGHDVPVGDSCGLVHLYKSSYITLKNLIIQNSPEYGIATDYLSPTETNPNHDITIYGCTIQDCIYGRGINLWCENKDPLYHIYNIFISHCEFNNVGKETWSTIDDIRKQECLTFRFLRDSVFEYNKIRNLNVRVGMEIHGSENILIDHNFMDGTGLHSSCFLLYINSQASGAPGNDSSKNIKISNNILTGACQTLGLCSESGTSSYLDGITIENNIITPTGGFDAIFMYYCDVTNYFKNILIRHNTVYTSGSGSSCLYIGSRVTSMFINNIVVANNIFMASSSGDSELINAQGLASTSSDFLMHNNVFYKINGGATTNFLNDDGFMGTGYITSNPLLVSPGKDFHLQSGSPAINSASVTYGVSSDFDGYLRDSQPDIGAYEYYTTSLPPGAPIIDGPISGKVGVTYYYNFFAFDPNGDDVYYRIDWGDGTPITEWIGPYPSGQGVIVTHIFTNIGLLTIKCQAKDADNSISDWGQLKVTMPYSYNMPLFQFWGSFLERFPRAFLLLRQLMGY